MPRKSKSKPLLLSQAVTSSTDYPIHYRVAESFDGASPDESLAAGDIIVLVAQKEDTFFKCRDCDGNTLTISEDCPFTFIETGLPPTQTKEEWEVYLESSLIHRPGHSLSVLARYPLPIVVALKDEAVRNKHILPTDCIIFDRLVRQRVIVCHRNVTDPSADLPQLLTISLAAKLKLSTISESDLDHDYDLLWPMDSKSTDNFSLAHRIGIGIHPPAQQRFNARVSHRGRYKQPETQPVRRSTMAVPGSQAPSPYRRVSAPPTAAPAAAAVTSAMFGRPTQALSGQHSRPRLPSNPQHVQPHRPSPAGRRESKTAPSAAQARNRKAYQMVKIEPRPGARSPHNDGSSHPRQPQVLTNGSHELPRVTLAQVRRRAQTTTAATSRTPAVSVPKPQRASRPHTDIPTPPSRPSLHEPPKPHEITHASKDEQCGRQEQIAKHAQKGMPEPLDYSPEMIYDNFNPADASNAINGPADDEHVHDTVYGFGESTYQAESVYGVTEGNEPVYGAAMDVLSNAMLFGDDDLE